jgi:hypothetical protein
MSPSRTKSSWLIPRICEANEEEAADRIEAIEAEYERTGKATDFDEFIEEVLDI